MPPLFGGSALLHPQPLRFKHRAREVAKQRREYQSRYRLRRRRGERPEPLPTVILPQA